MHDDFAVSESYDAASSGYWFVEGVSSEICTFNIKAAGDGDLKRIRVNVKEDIHGIINLSSAQMVEDIVEEEAAEAKWKPAPGLPLLLCLSSEMLSFTPTGSTRLKARRNTRTLVEKSSRDAGGG